MTLRGPAAPFALATLMGLAGRAHATDTSNLQDLLNETVITTASASTESSSTAPAISSILTAADIRTYGIHSLEEAINFLSLGIVTANSLATVEVGARGVLITKDQGNHFRLLINGHGVNEPYFGSARYDRGVGVPMEMIDHIECILGPGSLLYGSNAMLGVINIVTKYAKDFEGAHAIAESELLKSYRFSVGAGYTFSVLGRPAEVTFGAEYYTQAGPTFTLGPQDVGLDPLTATPISFSASGPATGIWGGRADKAYFSKVPSAYLRAAWGDFTLLAHGLTYKRSAPYGSTVGQSLEDFNDPGTYELDRRLSIELKYERALSRIVNLKSRLYGDNFDFQQRIQISNLSGCSNYATSCESSVLAILRWLGLENQVTFNWRPDIGLVTLLGVDGQVRSIGSQTDLLDGITGAPLLSSLGTLDKVDAIIGAYLQQSWQPRQDLGFNGGVRVDYDPRFAPAVSPRLAINYVAGRGVTLKAIYTQAFRAPSWFETSASTFSQILSSNLSLEREQSIEFSMEKKFSSNKILLGLFRSRWTDLVSSYVLSKSEIVKAISLGQIPFSPGISKVNQFRNINSINNYGFNAGIDGQVLNGRLRYGLNVTGAIAQQDSGTNETSLPVTPKIFGNMRVSYDFQYPWPAVGVAGHFFGNRFATGVDVGRVPPQLELRGTVSGRVPKVKGLSYRVSANYVSSSKSPYLIGPGGPIVAQFGEQTTIIQLAPVDVFRTTVGLQYDFL